MNLHLDWIASAIGLLGCYLVGKGKPYGWLFYASASAINAYLGYSAGLLGLCAGSGCYMIMELKGLYMHRRRKDDKD